MEFFITKTLHIIIECEVNNVIGKFIVDTGASNSCLDYNRAVKFNLNFEKLNQNALSASDEIKETFISYKNQIKIGKWIIGKRDLILFNMNHINKLFVLDEELEIDGIIGSDILVEYKATIDLKKNKISLEL